MKKRFFGLKLKTNRLLKNFLVLFLVIVISISPSLFSWLGFKETPLVQKALAQQVQTFTTADNGTWTAPAGVTEVIVEVWGAGGGTSAPPNRTSRGGGGGGAYSRSTLTVVPESNYSYVVGAGGIGGTNGGDTYWVNTSTVMAKGGVASVGTAGGAGGAQASGTGTVKYSGGTGGDGAAANNANGGGGGGGAGSSGNGESATNRIGGGATADYGGAGGDGSLSAGVGQNGSIYGGGAGGSSRSGGTGDAATNGADGFIRITYTPTPFITVGTTGTQASSVEADTADFYIGGAFTFVRSSDSTSVTSITISETGTISDSNISGLILYYKQEATCSTSIPVDATQFNSTAGTFTSGSSTVTGTMSVGTSQVCLYVEVDIGSGASNGDTILIQITNPSTQVTASAGNVSPATAVAISGTTTVAVNQAPSFTAFSNNGPVDPGTNITFTATGSDPDSDTIKLVVCKTAGVTGTECDGGAGDTWCTSTLVASNPSCAYSIPIPTPDTSYNVYPYVFDSKGLGSGSTLQGTLDTYTVNNVAPTVSGVTINGGSAINLNAGTTKSVDITGTVTDNNGCEDIDTVLGYAYRSGVGEVQTTLYVDCMGQTGFPIDNENAWDNEANVIDGNTGTYATATAYSTGEGVNNLDLDNLTLPEPREYGTISKVRIRLHNGSNWGDYGTITAPTGGWTWSHVQLMSYIVFADNMITNKVGLLAYEDLDHEGTILGSAYVDNVSGSYRISKIEIEVTHKQGTTDNYYFDASDVGPTDPDTVWTDDSNAFDGLTSTYAYSSTSGSTENNYLYAKGTSIPTNRSEDITRVEAKIYFYWNGSSAWTLSGNTLQPAPTEGWTWTELASLSSLTYISLDPITLNYNLYYSDGTLMSENNILDFGYSLPLGLSLLLLTVYSEEGCNNSAFANLNNCYPEITCTVDTGTCTGSTDASATYTCTANLQYFADPTDANTQYPTETWLSTIKATDNNSATGNAEVSQGVEMNSLMGFNITTEINYGSLGIGESNDPLDRITTITPTGNIGLDHEVYGPANMCTDFPTCSGSTIAIAYQKYALSASTTYSSATALSTTVAPVYTNVLKPTSTSPATKSIWWGMLVPDLTDPGTYNGSITITGMKSDVLNW